MHTDSTILVGKPSWITIIFLIFAHLIGIVGCIYLYLTHQMHYQTWILAFAYYLMSCISISLGYHRYLSHRAYKTILPLKILFLLFAPAALANSALWWCSEHRRHHQYTDTDKDPYNIKQGFWYAHITWACYKPLEDFSNVTDLMRDPWILLQHKLRLPLMLGMGLALPVLIASLWHDPLGGLIIAGFLRMVVIIHLVSLINSICHYYGSQPYPLSQDSSRNNWLVALLTFGEGYHNSHHRFPFDYRLGRKFYDIDIGKWLIKLFSFCKITSDLRTASEVEQDSLTSNTINKLTT